MISSKTSEGRTPLLTDQDNGYDETSLDTQQNQHHIARVHFQPEVLHIAETRVTPQPSKCSPVIEIALKVILAVAFASGFLWTATKLWSAYSSPKYVALVSEEYYYKETILLKHKHQGAAAPMCDVIDNTHRFDCHPGPEASQTVCVERGCCWRTANGELEPDNNSTLRRATSVPYCYFPTNYPSYETAGVLPTEYGYRANLQSTSNFSSWPGNIQNLVLDVAMETDNRLHFKIIDAKSSRYEVPISTPKAGPKSTHPEYVFNIKSKPFGFVVKRRKTDTIVFDTSIAPMLYADQYLQLSTSVPSGFVYGLGEHRSAFRHNATIWHQLSLWARDQPPRVNENLYGVHPFFMSIEKDGSAYGVFLLNSNAMDIDMQPYPALTYRTIGGILDFYIFMGPSPADVIQQYAAVVGRPAMPPYWALGFHLCRWGYGGTAGIQKVIDRMRNASFPYDTQWMDIDYMNKHLDWTYDKKNYAGLPDVVKDLHDNGQHFVIIVDPGISNQLPGKYAPYDEGIKKGVFVKNYKGDPLEGQVWPGRTVYPDFSNPATQDWWYDSAKSFHDQIPFDGLWTDMNEPSNFVQGSTSGCSSNSLDNPPYTPGILGGQLKDKTLCPSAQHHLGSHYNLHNLYGHMEAQASHRALERIRGKRSLVITRSTFASTGQYAGHWSGDNVATWEDLYYSIPVMLSFQMFAIPLVGADICGFSGETTEELCTRWMQLAAFYPFMRNHNMIKAKDQDPASFSDTAQSSMRAALIQRYTFLPHLYTLFYHSHTQGSAVINSLSFIFPGDSATHSIDKQFMWGTTLLISPVLKQGETSVRAYLPNDTWYDMTNGSRSEHVGQWVTLDAPLSYINLHVRGGSIIPQQHPLGKTTTTQARSNPFELLVALDSNGAAAGDLYWDDGDSINSTENGIYSLFRFTAKLGQLSSQIEHTSYRPKGGMLLGGVTIMGVEKQPTTVTVNSISLHFNYGASTKVLSVDLDSTKVELSSPLTIKWS